MVLLHGVVRLTLLRAISIVHRRAFSFTDDSASVPLRADPGAPLSTAARSRDQLFLRSMDTAPQLIKFRQIQSFCYQELFQSGRQPSQESWRSVWSALRDMHEWYHELPASLQEPMKAVFRSEMLFCSMLILSPSEKLSEITEFAENLIFEYALDYAEIMRSVCEETGKYVFYTYLDALRTSYVGRRLLDVLQSKQSPLLTAVAPSSPQLPSGSPPPPFLPNRGSEEKIDKAMKSIEQLTDVLEILG